MKLTPILPIVLAIALSGCSSTRVQFAPTTFNESPELMTCADAPAKPAGNYTQKDVAKYIKKYEYAHKDCKDDLATLNQEVATFNTTVKAAAKKKK